MERNRDTSELGLGKGDEGDGHRRPDGPLDGTTSGTIGGGGPDAGGSTARPAARKRRRWIRRTPRAGAARRMRWMRLRSPTTSGRARATSARG